MRLTVLRISKQEHGAIFQSLHTWHRRAPVQKRRSLKRWENDQTFALKPFFLRCLSMARIWRTRHSGVCTTNWHAQFQSGPELVAKRLAHVISCIHSTSEYRQCCHVGNTAAECRSGLNRDSDFAGGLETSKSISGGILSIFGSRTFVPITYDTMTSSLMCQMRRTPTPH